MSPQGTVIWDDEFEFKPPPYEWKVIQVEGEVNSASVFMRVIRGPFPFNRCLFTTRNPSVVSTQF